ncbi:hypothetical protein J6590_021554 [Homalodisca vitripennis]|nr:hypothetical protein J6590_021554 [Homalodisca vitripennis]
MKPFKTVILFHVPTTLADLYKRQSNNGCLVVIKCSQSARIQTPPAGVTLTLEVSDVIGARQTRSGTSKFVVRARNWDCRLCRWLGNKRSWKRLLVLSSSRIIISPCHSQQTQCYTVQPLLSCGSRGHDMWSVRCLLIDNRSPDCCLIGL